MPPPQNLQKSAPETVLLRQPMPRYNFQARKLPKESSLKSQPECIQVSSQVLQAAQKSAPQLKPAIKTSGTLQQVNLDAAVNRKSATVKPFPKIATSDTLPEDNGATNLASVVSKTNFYTRKSGKIGDIIQPSDNTSFGLAGSSKKEVLATLSLNHEVAGLEYNDIPVPDAALLAHAVEGPSIAEKLEKAEKEIEMLKTKLEIQLQVNAELKRLLVASVGEDFERKVENLARDRYQLAMELGDFTKKMTEDYENLDQISIQADMWRSKYLASRVMIEELASARAFYSSQFQDSQQAVQELLNERYELRDNFLHSYKTLQQVKEAFDPFNAQKSGSLSSTNILDLAKSIRQLSEAVRFRLLPAHVGSHVMLPLDESWESRMTRAELLAYELLARQTTPPCFKLSMPSAITSLPKPYERFHPQVRHDNVTVNCCTKCKGEIKVA